MSRLRRRDNRPEIAVRRLLHAGGLRYRVAYRIPGQRRRTIDIAIPRCKLAVYLDGCFWHGCPEHMHLPKANAEWWVAKLAMNQARDAASTAQLRGLGWTVLRFWEHEPPDRVAAAVLEAVRASHPPQPLAQLTARVDSAIGPSRTLMHGRLRVPHHDVASESLLPLATISSSRTFHHPG
ncbi:very short patch repair endonuclease [Modestobacter roseus]|nr:very short patch repair endonuclease [Modestobacter roseus]